MATDLNLKEMKRLVEEARKHLEVVRSAAAEKRTRFDLNLYKKIDNVLLYLEEAKASIEWEEKRERGPG